MCHNARIIDEYDRVAKEYALKVLAAAQAMGKKLRIPCTAVYVDNKFPADGIIESAKKKHCDLIVMASHGRRGIARLLLGSQALAFPTHSKIPVLLHR